MPSVDWWETHECQEPELSETYLLHESEEVFLDYISLALWYV